MQEFLNIALGFPTIVWTALMALVTAYWLFVIVGALDIELLDFDIDFETDFDVDLDLDVSPDADVDAGVDVDAPTASPLVKVAVALGIGKVPLTILLSFFAFSGWMVSYFGTLYLAPMFKVGAVGAIILAVAFVIAIPAMGAFAHPLKGLFETHSRHAGSSVIGKVCTITTGRVDPSFGQATLADGGAGLLLNVRCETDDNGLRRTSEALIIGYERESDVYFVEPYDQFRSSDSDRMGS